MEICRAGLNQINEFVTQIDTDEFRISESSTIPGLLSFERKLFADSRGFFQELCRFPEIEKVLKYPFVVKTLSITHNLASSIRAMHAEPIDKAVAPILGKGMMAWTDLRDDSEGFGRSVWKEFDLMQSNVRRICYIVPRGVANGVMFVEEGYYVYGVSGIYEGSEGKRAFRWNDPDAGIPWPDVPKHISKDDCEIHPFLRDMFPERFGQ